jgi:hypothetical protein
MAAAKGNQFWLQRSTHGRKPIFKDEDALWEAACEYFQWCEDNPLKESKICSFQGKNEIEEVPLMRAMTQSGLCLYLDIGIQTLEDYQGREDFTEVVTKVKEVIRDQKFSGAAAGLLNSNIIARDLGLADTKQITGTGAGGAIKTEVSTFNFIPVGPND